MDAARIEQIKRRTQPGPFYMGAIIASEFEDLLAALADAQATIERQAKELAEARNEIAELDRKLDDALTDGDTYQDAFDRAAALLEVETEYSNVRGVEEILEDMEAARDNSVGKTWYADKWLPLQAELARLRADARRLDYLITESNEARIDWLSDSFWDALGDGADVLAAARATIDAAMSEPPTLYDGEAG